MAESTRHKRKVKLEETSEVITEDVPQENTAQSNHRVKLESTPVANDKIYNCRLCLKVIKSKRIPIWPEDGGTWWDKMAPVCHIDISRDDKFTHICELCSLKLTQLQEFQEMCLRNNEEMKYINLQNDSIKMEPFDNIMKYEACMERPRLGIEADEAIHFKEELPDLGDDMCGEVPAYCDDPLKVEQANVFEDDPTGEEFQCPECPAVCSDRVELDEHQKSHKCLFLVKTNKFACSVSSCPITFNDTKSCRKHERFDHFPLNYQCEICGRFYGKKKLGIHRKQTHNKAPMICDTCGIRISSRQILVLHLATHSIQGKKKVFCSKCGKYLSARSIQNHNARLHSGRSHVCQYCNKEFNCRYNLKGHLRTHTGEMPFPCPDCDMEFRHRVSMKNHRLKVHAVNMFQAVAPPAPKPQNRKSKSSNDTQISIFK